MKLALALACTAACASADTEKPGAIDAPGSHDDTGPSIDAPRPIDAPSTPVEITISQSTDMTIASNTAFGCNQTSPQYTRLNSYFRVFHLADSGITTPFQLEKVSFGVQQAMAGTGTDQPVQLKIGTYSGAEGGTTLTGTTTPVNASSNLRVANGTLMMVDVPFTDTIPAGASLIVELAIPDGVSAHNVFFVGTNSAGEAKPSYILAPDCSVTTPTSMTAIADAQSPALTHSDLVFTVTGKH